MSSCMRHFRNQKYPDYAQINCYQYMDDDLCDLKCVKSVLMEMDQYVINVDHLYFASQKAKWDYTREDIGVALQRQGSCLINAKLCHDGLYVKLDHSHFMVFNGFLPQAKSASIDSDEQSDEI